MLGGPGSMVGSANGMPWLRNLWQTQKMDGSMMSWPFFASKSIEDVDFRPCLWNHTVDWEEDASESHQPDIVFFFHRTHDQTWMGLMFYQFSDRFIKLGSTKVSFVGVQNYYIWLHLVR